MTALRHTNTHNFNLFNFNATKNVCESEKDTKICVEEDKKKHIGPATRLIHLSTIKDLNPFQAPKLFELFNDL